jgi:hypothetical protein
VCLRTGLAAFTNLPVLPSGKGGAEKVHGHSWGSLHSCPFYLLILCLPGSSLKQTAPPCCHQGPGVALTSALILWFTSSTPRRGAHVTAPPLLTCLVLGVSEVSFSAHNLHPMTAVSSPSSPFSVPWARTTQGDVEMADGLRLITLSPGLAEPAPPQGGLPTLWATAPSGNPVPHAD